MSEEVRERFTLRTKLVSEIRRFYDSAGYLEVETPILQTLAGGATAEPFLTHHNALDTDFNLTIAQELYLKKLLIGGFNKVYEIGKKFRNEGIDTTHNPEFTMLESNEAYADAKSQREFIEQLFREVISRVLGKTTFSYEENSIDVSKSFAVFTFYDLIKKFGGIKNPESISQEELLEKAHDLGVKAEKGEAPEKIMDGIYKKTVRPELIQPTFIVDYPVAFNPFAKRKEEDPSLIDRFQLVIGGLEVVNAFSELNNPIDQKERYEEQDKKKRQGEGDISPSDLDYLEAMEHGMPPNGGIGIGIDRVAMLLSGAKNIKEVILFPTLKPKSADGKDKKKGLKIAVAIVNKETCKEKWQELNAAAHLGAALAARIGKSLLSQDEVFTKDAKGIRLNIKHAIMMRETDSSKILLKILKVAKEKGLEIAEFTKDMIESTNDKKVMEKTKAKNFDEIEYLGLLVFGDKDLVEEITAETTLYK